MMKSILLLTVMTVLLIGSAITLVERANASVRGARVADVEGVIMNEQKAQAKPGYEFTPEGTNGVSVWKTKNNARLQTGSLYCKASDNRTCQAHVGPRSAQCSSGCRFIGVRGGILAP